MGQRYDVCTPRPDGREEGKTWWHKVGSAWKNDKGLVTVYLDSIPLPDPEKGGKVVMMLFEPKEKEGDARTKTTSDSKTSRQTSRHEDGEIPF